MFEAATSLKNDQQLHRIRNHWPETVGYMDANPKGYTHVSKLTLYQCECVSQGGEGGCRRVNLRKKWGDWFMTPELRFEMVVIWDFCRVQQLNLLQHHVSRSPTSWSNKMKVEAGWISESHSFSMYNADPLCQSTTQRMAPSHQIN